MNRFAATAIIVAIAGSTLPACAQTPKPTPVGAPSYDVASAEQLVRAMHDRYADRWYGTLSFKQTVTRTAPDGTQPPKEVWAEWAEIPGKLRIDLAEQYNGNGVIYSGDSLFVFRNGAVVQRVAQRNPLMALGFDVYRQPVDETLRVLREEGFDLSKLREDMWQGRPVWVVGAAAGDTTSKQFWVDRARLLFVRMLEPLPQDTTKMMDIRFDEYQRLGDAWISPLVVFQLDGREVMREEYFDMKADPQLPAGLFDPARWGE